MAQLTTEKDRYVD